MTRSLWSVSLLLALLAVPSAVLAHRDDQYLQATLVAVEPGGVRLDINLTPGVAVAENVETIAVSTLLAVYDWTSGKAAHHADDVGQRCAAREQRLRRAADADDPLRGDPAR